MRKIELLVQLFLEALDIWSICSELLHWSIFSLSWTLSPNIIVRISLYRMFLFFRAAAQEQSVGRSCSCSAAFESSASSETRFWSLTHQFLEINQPSPYPGTAGSWLLCPHRPQELAARFIVWTFLSHDCVFEALEKLVCSPLFWHVNSL